MPEPFVAHRVAWRTLLLIAASLAFVAIGLWLAGVIGGTDFDGDPGGRLAGLSAVSGSAPSTVAAVIGWICASFFGLCAIAGVGLLFQRGPVLRIDAQGVQNHARSDAVIPWDQVYNPRVLTMNRQSFVVFDLADPARFPATSIVGRLGGVNRMLGFGGVTLSVTGTDRRFAEMEAAFLAFLGDARGGVA